MAGRCLGGAALFVRLAYDANLATWATSALRFRCVQGRYLRHKQTLNTINMRKISVPQIAAFASFYCLILALGGGSAWILLGEAPLGDFRALCLVGGGLVLIYLYAFVVYRGFILAMPLPRGELAPGSAGEFVAHVNTLFYLMLFYPLTRTHFIPTPLMRLVYLALGARLGDNTYSGGLIMDPPLTSMGDNCIVGHDAVLFAHVIEGSRLALYDIKIGHGVTIGATAVVMPDVLIGDGAVVCVGAVVTKGTRIGAGEVWGGIPARKLGMVKQPL